MVRKMPTIWVAGNPARFIVVKGPGQNNASEVIGANRFVVRPESHCQIYKKYNGISSKNSL